jgi:hypothetical protein
MVIQCSAYPEANKSNLFAPLRSRWRFGNVPSTILVCIKRHERTSVDAAKASMSALGQKQTFAVHQAMSALLTIATAKRTLTDTVF